MVVSVEKNVPLNGISCGSERRAQANHPMRCRKLKDEVKTGGYAEVSLTRDNEFISQVFWGFKITDMLTVFSIQKIYLILNSP